MAETRNGDPYAAHLQTAPSYERSFEEGRPAIRVVEAVPRANLTSPAGLTPPLSETIDPDAPDRSVDPVDSGRRRSGGGLGFTVVEWDVVDWRDEHVRVFEADER